MRIILLISLALMLSGCFSTGRHATQPLAVKPKPVAIPAKASHSVDNELRWVLEQQYETWAGTPYRLGGVDFSGVDCSALVQNIFTEAFDIELPRTTSQQVSVGEPVDKKSLEPLDLVFFKTGRTRHVGIYLGEGEFLHASTSQGVIISTLNNPYWKRHYWTARRTVDPLQLASL